MPTTSKVALAALLAFCALRASVAAAQSETWTDPHDRFSLSFAHLGWTELQPRADDPGLLLAIEHREFQQAGSMRTCFVTERRQPISPQVTQTELNALFSARGLAALERTMRSSATESELLQIDGVAVIEATFAAPLHQQVRVFYLKDRADLVQILINCGASGSAPPEVISNVSNLLQTLRVRDTR